MAGGEFYLDVDAPSGLLFTLRDQGDDDELDSDAAGGTGVTGTFTLDAGESDSSHDAGLKGTKPSISIDDVALTEGDTGITVATFTVSLSSMTSEIVTVCYETTAVSATAGADYASASWTLTFQPGVTSQTVTVQINSDITDELNEVFHVILDDPVNATLADSTGIGTILDDDDAPVIAIGDGEQVAADPIPESTAMTFAVQLSNPSYQSITVNYRTLMTTEEDGSLASDGALAGADYESTYETAPGSLTFAPGETEKTITISIIGDLLDEYDERFLITLALDATTPSNAASLGDVQGVGTILDDDASPTVFIDSPTIQTVAEGYVGTTPVTFTVSLSAVSGREVQVNFATNRGTALETPTSTEDNDYSPASGTLVLGAGDTSRTMTVDILGDVNFEPGPPEYFFVNLLSGVNATVGNNHGVVKIMNDDAASGADLGPWSIQFGSPAYSVLESGGNATITLLRTDGSSQPIAVYWTLDGTATNGTDYAGLWENGASPPRRLIRFAEGETVKTFEIPIIDDSLVEGDETVRLFLKNPTGGPVRGEIKTAVLTIVDDESLPSITVGDASAGESSATITFKVTLSESSEQTVTVNWATANGTAGSGSDYILASGTVTFAPHDTSEDVVVTLISDTTPELTETFVINLEASSAANATIADYQGTGTITDNDEATITGYVFMDVNGNGFFDESTEWVLEDVTVDFEDSQGGTDTDTTDASGYYSVNVLLGEVRVEVEESTVPEGSALSTDNSPQTAEVTTTVLTIDPIGYTIETSEGVPASSIGNGGGYIMTRSMAAPAMISSTAAAEMITLSAGIGSVPAAPPATGIPTMRP